MGDYSAYEYNKLKPMEVIANRITFWGKGIKFKERVVSKQGFRILIEVRREPLLITYHATKEDCK